jgi:hypothetical protein
MNITKITPQLTDNHINNIKSKIINDPTKKSDNNLNELFNNSLKTIKKYTSNAIIYREISKDDFEVIFNGEGKNITPAPLEEIFPEADKLILFALTIGIKITQKIDTHFKKREFATAYILDFIASEYIEIIADLLEEKFRDEYTTNSLRFSPGYCGWDISGQKKLFKYLAPEKIGISLTDSFLMIPLKSISGVIVVGNTEIFEFNTDLPCCESCDTKLCKDRMNNQNY